MNLSARMVVERIALEHLGHGGANNGRLVVTYDNFVKHGIRRASIALAIEQARALGWIQVVERGRSYGEAHTPSLYALTWLPTLDGKAASNRWKAISTDERALAVIERARSNWIERPEAQDRRKKLRAASQQWRDAKALQKSKPRADEQMADVA